MDLDPQIIYALLFGIIYLLGLMKGIHFLLSVRTFDLPSLEYQLAYEQSKVVRDECSICLQPLNIEDNAILTRCGHWFHDKGCLTHLNQYHCPLCRETITNDSLIEEDQYCFKLLYGYNSSPKSKESYMKVLKYMIFKSSSTFVIEKIIQVLQAKTDWDINERFMDGTNNLLYASRLQNYDAVRTLVKKGADINSCDFGGRNALDLAIIHHQDALASIFINDGIQLKQQVTSCLQIVIQKGLLNSTKSLFKRFANDDLKMTEYKDGNGQSLLHLAVKSGNLSVVDYISEQFEAAKLNIDCLDKWNQSPLLLACKAEKLNNRIASILIKLGAKFDLEVENQFSPLEHIIHFTKNEDEFLTTLLSRVAKVESRLIELARTSEKESYARILEDPIAAQVKKLGKNSKVNYPDLSSYCQYI